MGRVRLWTQEEREYLEEKWGTYAIDTIARKLGRTEKAIIQMARRLELGSFILASECVTLNEFCKAIGKRGENRIIRDGWIKARGMPVHKRRIQKRVMTVIKLEEFWRWAELNRSFVDLSRMEPLALGKEPKWVEAQRKKNAKGYKKQRKWTPIEDETLRALVAEKKFGYQEVARRLDRSVSSITKRCYDLGLSGRPVKQPNNKKWTETEKKTVERGILEGEALRTIADRIGRSEKAVCGYLYLIHGTQALDIVRQKILGKRERTA